MGKLTESMVLQRTRQTDLESVRELNCWGSDLTDVSIVRRMPNIQILSLSVNRISTLRDFKCCLALKDLYLRKNCIEDLSELMHLQALPNLRVLWLAENPCAYLPDYRNTVLRYLPNLLKLDNIAVSVEELRQATCYDDDSQLDDASSQLDSDSELSLPLRKPANILQAVLCLINELDRDALEVVDDAVRNRLDISS